MSRIEKIIAKCEAKIFVAKHKKHSDLLLYRVLSDCMKICEICFRDAAEARVLDELIKKLPLLAGKQRHYVEKSSDMYQRVCRYMFYGEENSSNINRYAICLREAAKTQIASGALVGHLKSGGINKFYLRRPNLTNQIATKCIRLDRQIVHRKDRPIRLELLRQNDNSYKVLECAAS